MKIFLTGSTGYIGQKLLIRLISEGHSIHALCRRRPEGELYRNPRITIFEGDLLNKETILTAMEGCDQAYHVAAYAKVWAKDPETFFKVNVQGSIHVFDAAMACGVKRVVYTSTGGTFGISNGKPITEETTRLTNFFTEYESSKFMAEERALWYAKKGLDVIVVNPVRVYGPGMMTESNPLSHIMKAYISGNWHVIPGNGKAISSFSYIDDVVDGHIMAMEKGVSGEKYILGGVNSDFNTFFSLLEKLSGRHYFLFRIPVGLLMAFAWKEEIMAKWLGAEPMITRKWVRKYNFDMGCSSNKAISHLGYRITPLEAGISKTLQWLGDEYKIYP